MVEGGGTMPTFLPEGPTVTMNSPPSGPRHTHGENFSLENIDNSDEEDSEKSVTLRDEKEEESAKFMLVRQQAHRRIEEAQKEFDEEV